VGTVVSAKRLVRRAADSVADLCAGGRAGSVDFCLGVAAALRIPSAVRALGSSVYALNTCGLWVVWQHSARYLWSFADAPGVFAPVSAQMGRLCSCARADALVGADFCFHVREQIFVSMCVYAVFVCLPQLFALSYVIAF
jgi:hypothetical protein